MQFMISAGLYVCGHTCMSLYVCMCVCVTIIMQLYSSQFRDEKFSTTCSQMHHPDDIVVGAIISMYTCIITSGLLVLHLCS